MLPGMVEQATSGDLSKPDINLNKKICLKIRDDESLYTSMSNTLEPAKPWNA